MALYTTTCLQMVQKACKRIGIPAPTVALTSTDLQIIQLVELLNEEVQELAASYNWSALITEATFTTLAAQLQTATGIATVAPGYKNLVQGTMWNRTLDEPVYPIDARDWQAAVAIAATAPNSQFRIWNNNIYFYPTPTAGQTVAFEYWDRRPITSSDEATKREAFSADADLLRLDPQLAEAGLIWRWKQAKGFEYAEDFRKYADRVMDAQARDGAKRTLCLTSYGAAAPGVLVPEGSWSL